MDSFHRIMIAGDCHGKINHVYYLLQMCENQGITTLLQVGDFGAWEHEAEGRKFFRLVSQRAVKTGVTVYWIDGNHDKISATLKRHREVDDSGFVLCAPSLVYIPRGTVWEWSGIKFLAFGGAYSVDKEARLYWEKEKRVQWERQKALGSRKLDTSKESLWFPEEEASEEDYIKAVGDGSRVDVMVTHDKPRASNPGWNRKDLMECWPNQDRIQALLQARKPRVLVHGHLHYPYEDRVRHAEGWTLVKGLDCDYAEHPGYNPRDSWCLLSLDRGRGGTGLYKEDIVI
jgi:predicted phosphodiesterase